ncbi:MAG: hypothetical protein DRP01_08425 [Archaeoglobales archaeon]|nr:MAG: hypothetical protein DRP01_08425 [Archaeoglobales archaeon]
MTKIVYLDATNTVIATSTKVKTLEEAQAINSSIITRVLDAPDQVVRTNTPGKLYYHQLTSGDGTDLSHYTEVEYLDAYKNAKIQSISLRTEELLALGFTYNSQRFSMSSSFAAVYSSLLLMDQKDSVTFPLPIHDLNGVPFAIETKEMLRTLLASAAAGIMGLQKADSQLREAILEAETVQDIDAITDDRLPVEIPDTSTIAVEGFSTIDQYRTADDTETKTNATSPRERLTLSVTELPLSNWRLEWYFEFKSAKSTAVAYTSVCQGETELSKDHLKGDDWKVSTGSKLVTLEGDHAFTINYWAKSKKYATEIRRLELRLVRTGN